MKLKIANFENLKYFTILLFLAIPLSLSLTQARFKPITVTIPSHRKQRQQVQYMGHLNLALPIYRFTLNHFATVESFGVLS